jgi:hypothetical protein
VIVEVRLIALLPDEKVNVAVPSSPVVTVAALRLPESALIVITMPDKAALEEFNAVTVIVEVVEPSDFTVGGEAIRSIDAGVVVVSSPPSSPPLSVLPPQATIRAKAAKSINRLRKEKNLLLLDFFILFSFLIREIGEFFKFNDEYLPETSLIFKIFFELST